MAESRGPVVGVDGGATKTDAVVMGGDGHVLGSGRANGSNWENVGLEGAVSAVALAVDAALEEAGVARSDGGFRLRARGRRLARRSRSPGARTPAAGLGGAGVRHQRCLRGAPCRRLGANGLRLVGGHGGRRGRAQRSGLTARTMAEGFGELGGAGDIVERALWACARMREWLGARDSAAAAFCAALGVADLTTSSRRSSGAACADASLAPLVLQLAERGDDVAVGLLGSRGDLGGRGTRRRAEAAHARDAVRARDRRERAPGRLGVAGRRVQAASLSTRRWPRSSRCASVP